MERGLTHRAPAHRARWALGLLVAGVLALCLSGIATLALSVRSGIQSQASASSDNTQWTMSQLDVEFLSYKEAVTAALTGTGDLAEVRKRFNIVYSRSNTFLQSKVFARVLDDESYAKGLAQLRSFLDGYIPQIDGPDEALRAALPRMAQGIDGLRPKVRELAVLGLKLFATAADREREVMVKTLVQVGVLTGVMIVFLLGLVAMLLRFEAANRARTREVMLSLGRTEAVVDTALDAVILVDDAGRVLDFNPAAERIFGYPRQQTLGQPVVELIFPAEQRAAHLAEMRALQQGRASLFTKAGRLRLTAQRADGTGFPAEISVTGAEDTKGAIFIAFLRDLSAEIAAEQALLAARDAALAGEKAKADLLAVMSHEMRTPLNGILGMLELMQDTPLTPRQQELQGVMQASGKLLLHHVNDVLDIARLESGKMPLQLGPVDLAAQIREVIASQSAASLAARVHLKMELSPGLPGLLNSDATQLRQVLLNLVGNAVKFTRDGEVTIRAAYDAEAAELALCVADSGIGIPEADLERIFDDFVTLDASYARIEGGTGLGLGITRRIVTNLGGTIRAESQLGKGSSFHLRLPMRPSQSRAYVAPAPLTPCVELRGKRILVVEDNPINRLVVREILAKHGPVLAEAVDGEEGVRMAAETRYDMIFMDISMPRMDGVAATRAIRAGSGQSKSSPIVALTAHAMAEEVTRFKAAGMQAVLVKPVSGAALCRAFVDHGAEQPRTNLLNAEVIAEFYASMGEERAAGLIAQFLAEVETKLPRLADPTLPDKELRREIHKLCGASAMFGAHSLNQALCALETLCKNGQTQSARAGIATLTPLWQQTRQALKQPSKAA
jgi:PAS domain S-box-containing protein